MQRTLRGTIGNQNVIEVVSTSNNIWTWKLSNLAAGCDADCSLYSFVDDADETNVSASMETEREYLTKTALRYNNLLVRYTASYALLPTWDRSKYDGTGCNLTGELCCKMAVKWWDQSVFSACAESRFKVLHSHGEPLSDSASHFLEFFRKEKPDVYSIQKLRLLTVWTELTLDSTGFTL